MDRIVDKALVLLCCLPALFCLSIDVQVVVSLLVAVGIAALDDVLVPSEARLAAEDGADAPWNAAAIASVVLPLAYCFAACFIVPAGAFIALSVYDLASSKKTLPLLLVALVALSCAANAGLSATAIAISFCASSVAAVLAWRSSSMLVQRASNTRDRDELRERSLQLEEKNRDLLDRQEYEAQLATLTERSRIAREIHDNVGHLLTRAIVQVEALRVVHADDPAVEAEFGTVANTLHEALDTTRSSVHALADDACDLSVQIRQVVDSACKGTGLSATCNVAAGAASPQVTACLTAVVREALSNTLRHADGATHVSVELVEHPNWWRLTVTDNGKEPSSSTSGAGMGLVSMEDRVRALGGTMRAEYSDTAHGFVVFASIPKDENEENPEHA